ncbi:MAG: hypothetical protein K2I18_01715 [Paramuribaculum sp.]|nr:hypothetical protein [Paramuribaculum sp.]
MKQLLFLAMVTFCLTASAATADDDTKATETHVQVILENGDTITGYIRSDLKTGLKNMFSKTGSIRQYINIGAEPKGGATKRYSAPEVKEYRFLEPTEAYPEGAVCVSDFINSPGMFKPRSIVRGFAWELDRRESGSVLRWDVWESTGGRNSVNRLVPAVGIKFKGANAAYPIMVNGRFSDAYLMIYLKKQYPELKEAWDEYYYKCEDAKAHRKELLDNVSTALLFYEDFLKTHAPLDDTTPAESSKK